MAAGKEKMLTLISSDLEKFEVEESAARESQTIVNMIEDSCADNEIPLPNVNARILDKVIVYCRKHAAARGIGAGRAEGAGSGVNGLNAIDGGGRRMRRGMKRRAADGCDAEPTAATNKASSEDELKTFDAEFVKVDQGTLFGLILAAKYLDIKGLLDLTCQTVANMFVGKTPEELRKFFNITHACTPEEEEEVRRENQWAF